MARYTNKRLSDILSRKLVFKLPSDMTDAEIERIIEAIEDDVSMGLEAVGNAVVEKYSGGKLSFQIIEE